VKRTIISLSIILALSFGAVPTATASTDAPVLSKVVESGVLRVGTSGAQPPFSVTSKSGEVIGYEIDLARLLAGAMNVEVKFVVKPFGQLLTALENGEVDVVMSGMTMTPARNLKAAFVGPYIVSGKSILTTSATLATISEAEEIDQSKLTLAALKGSTSEHFVKEVLSKATLAATDDYDAAIKMVLEDEADAMVADFPICALATLRYPDAGLATLVKPLTIEPIGMALPAGDSLLLNLVENYIGALQGTGLLDLLEEKWFEDGSWLIQVP
jgi:polar amino acid transport system substrate-binding protein